MGVDLETYRARIGSHAFRAGRAVHSKSVRFRSELCSSTDRAWISCMITVFLCEVALWSLASSQCGAALSKAMLGAHFSPLSWNETTAMSGVQPSLKLLLIRCGDVELNPGPPMEREEMDEMFERWTEKLHQQMTTSFQKLLSAEIAKLDKKIDSIQSALEQMELKLKRVKDATKVLESDVIGLNEQSEEMKEFANEIESRMEERDIRDRRDNLILYGVKESPKESHAECQAKFLSSLNNVVPELHLEEKDIARAHRLGRPSSGCRPIIARFLTTADKIKVLENKETLKENGLGASGDLTPNQRKQLKDLRDKGLSGYWRGGYLVVLDSKDRRGASEDNNDDMGGAVPNTSRPSDRRYLTRSAQAKRR